MNLLSSRTKRIIIISVIAVAVLAVTFLTIYITTSVIPKNHYNKAFALIETNDYDDARNEFIRAKNYKDSKELIDYPYYLKGISLMESGDYAAAKEIFSEISYQDSLTLFVECRYNLGVEHYNDGEFDLSISELDGLNYSDSQEFINKCYASKGESSLSVGDYDLALSYFTKAANLGLDGIERLKAEVYNFVHNYSFTVYGSALSDIPKKYYNIFTSLVDENYKDSKLLYSRLLRWKVACIVTAMPEIKFDAELKTDGFIYIHTYLYGGEADEEISFGFSIVSPSGVTVATYAVESPCKSGDESVSRWNEFSEAGRYTVYYFRLEDKSALGSGGFTLN